MLPRKGILKTMLAGVMVCTSLLWGGQMGQAAELTAIQKTSAKKVSAKKIVQIGNRYLGTPYKFGSSSLTTRTFDCSSFTQRVFYEAGIKLPRVSRQQATVGKKISKQSLQVGDLVFFKSYSGTSKSITHVAIYAGNNKLLHTYGKPGVTYSTFKGTSWERRFITARRVI